MADSMRAATAVDPSERLALGVSQSEPGRRPKPSEGESRSFRRRGRIRRRREGPWRGPCPWRPSRRVARCLVSSRAIREARRGDVGPGRGNPRHRGATRQPLRSRNGWRSQFLRSLAPGAVLVWSSTDIRLKAFPESPMFRTISRFFRLPSSMARYSSSL